ncbi:YwpF family protein [Planococcus shenhongbingii]|uniref:YwpF family protein n=1 Tax=Planococcus shenhongbingii TaxID=3058398 RepID=A0ABT8NA19_9BACL|nr:YwpF family protein [Planococcus sp. N017]MDN7244740.1 YwpF family protein [Planococcus sp. N017]
MKTFKMLSLGVVNDEEVINYPLQDGIIINQENSHRSWVLEMLMDLEYQETFQKMMNSGDIYDVKVVISYPDNEPATFQVAIYGVKVMGDQISVLMKGTLKRARRKYAESLLSELLEDGLEGTELLERFEHDMRTRPGLRKDGAKT